MVQPALSTNNGGQSATLPKGAWGWIIFESGRIPQLLLVSGFVFVPYFVTKIVGNAVRGQELIAFVQTWAGLLVAVTAPIMGSAVDRWGSRKPLLAAFVLIQFLLLASLWWAEPQDRSMTLTIILIVLGALTVVGGYCDLLFNSMMLRAVGRHGAAKGSGYALTCANVTGVLLLLAVLWAFELPGRMTGMLLPDRPLLGLAADLFEPSRIVGPICALILAIFSVPLFLFAADSPRSRHTVGQSIALGTGDLKRLLAQSLGTHRNIGIFLLARVAFFDAMSAYVAFSGIYAAGVMGWHGPEMLVFGIGSAIFCGIGAFVAQLLDRTIGPRRAVIIELSILSVFILGEIGMAANRILYMAYTPPAGSAKAADAIFGNTPDFFFLALAFGAAAMLVGAAASSRTLLVRLTPPAQSGAVFGLAALSGSATTWLAPLLIGLFTASFGSQQAGFVPLLVMLCIGIALLAFVRGGGRAVEEFDGLDLEVANGATLA